MRILIITTSQPSINPRMRKAADALASAGYDVHVLYAFRTSWATEADRDILSSCRWTFAQVGGEPVTQPWRYAVSRLRRKWAENTNQLEKAWCRSHDEYVKKGIAFQPDLVIGHNPGSLSPITRIAQALEIPAMFDAEDYHRGEKDATSSHSQRVTILEDRFIPKLSAMTAASPMITEAYSKLYPEKTITTVNNAFPKNQLQPNLSSHEGPLRMVWFSQVVGLDRGLEPFLKGISLLSDIPIELTIIGQCAPGIMNELVSNLISPKHTLRFEKPMNESDLFTYLSKFEIGLALEIPKTENRKLCRTNKLYTYPLVGCYTLASDTPSQEQFYNEFPELGKLINLDDTNTIHMSIAAIWEQRAQLGNQRRTIIKKAEESLNWEIESQALIKAAENCLPAR